MSFMDSLQQMLGGGDPNWDPLYGYTRNGGPRPAPAIPQQLPGAVMQAPQPTSVRRMVRPAGAAGRAGGLGGLGGFPGGIPGADAPPPPVRPDLGNQLAFAPPPPSRPPMAPGDSASAFVRSQGIGVPGAAPALAGAGAMPVTSAPSMPGPWDNTPPPPPSRPAFLDGAPPPPAPRPMGVGGMPGDAASDFIRRVYQGF